MNFWIVAGAVAGLLFTFGNQVVETVEDALSGRNTQFDPLFQKYGAKYGVPWTWLAAIAENESRTGREKSVAAMVSSTLARKEPIVAAGAGVGLYLKPIAAQASAMLNSLLQLTIVFVAGSMCTGISKKRGR